MRKYAHINTETGEIVQVSSLSINDGYSDGQVRDSLLIRDITDLKPDRYFSSNFYYAEDPVIGFEFVPRPTRPSIYYKWSISGWEHDYEMMITSIRAERDKLLYQSDWTQLPDAPLTAEEKLLWNNYRQALRDIPNNITTEKSPEDILWPTAP